MKQAEWVNLIQIFPPADFDGFGIILHNSLEISLQTVLQLNSDHMLIRGRTVGSTDAGRYFYLPYDQISCIVYNRPKSEEEVLSWYDGQPSAAAPAAKPAEEEPAEQEVPEETTPAAAASNRTAAPGSRPSMPSIRPAAPKPAAAPGVVRPAPAMQEASGLQTSALANAQNNPIKAALLERLRARRQGQDPAAPEK